MHKRYILLGVPSYGGCVSFPPEPSGPAEPRREKLPHFLRPVSRNQQPAERWDTRKGTVRSLSTRPRADGNLVSRSWRHKRRTKKWLHEAHLVWSKSQDPKLIYTVFNAKSVSEHPIWSGVFGVNTKSRVQYHVKIIKQWCEYWLVI